MRGGGGLDDFRADLAQPENGGGGVRPAREPLDPHKPMRRGGRQLRFRGSALRKDRNATRRQQARGVGQQIRERSQGAGGNHGERWQPRALYAARVDTDMGKPKLARGLDEEGGFAPVRFHQMRFLFAPDSDDEPGEPTPRAEIRERTVREQGEQLPAIQDVALPKRIFRRCRNQVDATVPIQQQPKIGAQLGLCFT